jgi:hypothetical protein
MTYQPLEKLSASSCPNGESQPYCRYERKTAWVRLREMVMPMTATTIAVSKIMVVVSFREKD